VDIVQAVLEALLQEPVQLIPEHLEFINDTVEWHRKESNLDLQESLVEAMADRQLSLQEALKAHKRWLTDKFNSIPEVTDWDMDLLFELERRHTKRLLDQAVSELKTFIRERTPPPEYRA